MNRREMLLGGWRRLARILPTVPEAASGLTEVLKEGDRARPVLPLCFPAKPKTGAEVAPHTKHEEE